MQTTTIGAVTERAMLIDLSVKMWSAAKHDKKVSAEVADAHGADHDAGRYNKRLIAKDARQEIQKVATEARDYHYSVTLPWMDNGARILPSASFFDYTSKMATFDDRWTTAVRKFVDAYPSIVNDAQAALNGLFDANDYPAPSQIKRRFAFGYNVFPLPTADDFRVDLGTVEIDRIRQQITASTEQAFSDAVKDVYGRITEAVGHMARRLREYKVTAEGVEHPFRDSLVENVRELAGLLPALNVTADAGLAAVTAQILRDLTEHDADTLRASQNAREQTAAAAERILDAVSEFLA